MLKDGVELSDEGAAMQLMINQPLQRLMRMRALVISGIMMILTGAGLGILD